MYAKKRIELGRRIFKAIDSNRLGVVGRELLGRAFDNVFDMGLKDDEVDKVMLEINNKSSSTTIDQATFETWFLEINPVARLLETQYNNVVVKRRREMSRNIFAAIDFKNRGNIDISTLRKAFKAFKIGVDNEQIVQVMRELINNTETPIDTAMVSPRQFETWFLEQTKIGLLLQKRVEEVFHNDTTQVDDNRQKKNLKSGEEKPEEIIVQNRARKNGKQGLSNRQSNQVKKSKIPVLKGTHNSTRGRQQRGHLPKAEIEEHRKAAEKRNKAYFLKQKAEKKRKKEIEMRKKRPFLMP